MTNSAIIIGNRALIEAINSNVAINKIFIQKGHKRILSKELESLIHSQGLSVSYVPKEKLDKLSRKGIHQGVVAQISPIGFIEIEKLVMDISSSSKTPLFLLLDQINDVRNFGAIIRTAECSGVDGIIIQKKGAAPVNKDVIKTSTGALFKVPICKVDHIKDAIYYLQGSGIKVIAATEKSDNLVYDASFDMPCAILLGSEGKGIAESVLKIVDERLKLPMYGTIKSFNVSVACGMFLYEIMRQRSK